MATQKFEPFSGKLDAATEFEPFDGTLDGEPAKPASAARKLADLGLGFASGAVGATKALTDVAGAGNKASKVLADLNTGINDYLSPEAKADQQEQGRIMSDAGGKGVWEGVKAGAKAFAVAPVQTAVQGLGSVVPIVAGTALTGGAAPAAAVGAGMGVAMGAGTAKGAIYDEIKKRGGTEEQAIRAQEYGGSNTDQIALGGALGVVDALTGVSKAASGVVRGALGKPVAQAATQAAERGIVSRAGMGMLGEMPLEAAQGGQEQVAANLAAQRAGYEAGTWDNVASNATMEALASAGPGAAFGAMDTGNKQTPPPPPPPAPQPDQPAPPAGLLGNTPDPLISFPDGTVGRRSEVDAYVASLPEDQQPAMRARLMGLAPQPAIPAASEAPVVEPVAPPSVQMGIDPSYGPLSRAAATAVDTGIAQEIEFNQATAEDQAAYDQAMAAQEQARAEQDSVDKPITSGAIAESQMSEADRRAVLFSNKYVEDGGARHVGTLDGDVLNGMGAPFATRLAAARRANMEGKDWTIAPVFDGWVARRKDAIDGASDGVRGPAAGSSEQGSDQPAPGVGLGATDGNGVGADARGRADDAVGESRQLPGGVDDAAVEQPIIQTEKQEQATPELTEKLSNSEQKDNEVAKTPQPSAALSPYQQKIADAKSNGDTEVALKWGDFEVRQSATNGNPDFAVVQTSSGKVVAKGLGSVETAAIIASGRADAGQGAGASQPTQAAPAWWTERSDDERQMLLKLSGFKNANADWSKMTDDQRSTIGKHYAEFESGETQNQKLKKSDLDHLFGVDQKRTKALDRIAAGNAWFSNPMKAADFITKNGLKETHKSVRTGPKRWDVQAKESEANAPVAPADIAQPATNTVAQPEETTNGTQAPETQQAEAQQPQERAPGQPVEEQNLQAAKNLLAQQKAATGNAVAEGAIRKKLRDLAAKTPISDAKTVSALDIAATRLGMGEGKLKGLEFAPAAAPVSNTRTADDELLSQEAIDRIKKNLNDPAKTEQVMGDIQKQVDAATPAQREPTEHAGLKIYPVNVKVGDKVEQKWGVQTLNNSEREKKGERQLGGDPLADTLEGAKKLAEQEVEGAKRLEAYRAEMAALDDKKKEADAVAQAKKDANKGKSIAERRKDSILDGPTKLHPNAGLGTGTKREAMQKAVEQDRYIQSAMVRDEAAKKRDQESTERARRTNLPTGNINYPGVKEYFEAVARLKADDYTKPEYRVYDGRDTKGAFREISKTEYDYAQELKGKQSVAPVESAQAATETIASEDATPKTFEDDALNVSFAKSIVDALEAKQEGRVGVVDQPSKPDNSVKVEGREGEEGSAGPVASEDTDFLADPETLDAEKIKAGYAHRSTSVYSKVEMERNWYVDAIKKTYDYLLPIARNPAQLAKLKDLLRDFRDEYRTKRYQVLDAGASAFSVVAAGRHNFNHKASDRSFGPLESREKAFNAWLEQKPKDIEAQLLRLRTEEEKAGDDAKAEKKRINALVAPIVRDLAQIMAIDLKQSPMDRASFVGAAIRQIANLHKSGETEALNQVFAKIAKWDAEHTKPLFSARSPIWLYKPTSAPENNTEAALPANEAPADVLDAEKSLWGWIGEGIATVDEFKAGFENWVNRKDEIISTLMKNTKDQLLKMGGGWFTTRHKSDNKADIVKALWRDGLGQYALGRSVSYTMGEGSYEKALRAIVEATDADQLAQHAQQIKANTDEAVARVGKIAEAIKDPKTLDDYRTWMRATMGEGKTFKEARMMLTPEQRAKYDDLTAADSRSKRKSTTDAQRSSVAVAGQTVDGNIIATKHTKKGHDVFVVQLAERVSKEDYGTLNAGAKRIGGYYSSFRGAGAVPGFQFADRAQAEAFVKLAQGDNTEAQAAAQERRDAFADDRSQTATQRLEEMADRLEDQADTSLSQDRKQNTDKRARQAASAEAAANADKAMAKTMRNIATSISDGTAKFLDRVRQKTQVAMLQGFVKTAKDVELRAKYESYAEQERNKGEPPTGETADYAEFPYFTAYRSDLATLARQLLDVDGTKLLGQKLLKGADDVSDAYLKFSKENLGKVSIFRTKEGGLAGFGTKSAAEDSIARSGYKGKAIAYQVKRGEYTVIASPTEAVERGIWNGDGDKRITLTPEIGNELVEKIGKAARRGAKVSVPWQLETAHDRQKALSRMGIETPAEFRAALREFIGLQEQAAAPNKIKELERAMIGRRNDGMDFFPTPESVADEMVSAAGIEPGMAVLEPSAGWGHIAERIRAMEVEPDVIELSGDRRELLEAKGFNVVANDFTGLTTEDLPNGVGYDRILMNPPFSDGRDIQHVQHAYTLLKPGGRIVAIMGESAFTNQNKRSTEFREWLESVGGTEEKLAEGSFNDPSLPVNTGANARMVVIERAEGGATDVVFSQGLLSQPSFGPKPTLDQIQRLVDKVQAVAKNVIPITVIGNASQVPGVKIPVGAKPTGALIGGRIYIFADNIKSLGDAHVTLFHEIFHLGLQKVIPAEDYAVLLRKFAGNLMVQQFVRTWKASPEGVEKAASMPSQAYEALAAEEALAMVSEELYANDSIGSNRLPGLVKTVLSWMANVADSIGFPSTFGNWMRGLTRTDAEKFVSDMVRSAMGGDKNLAATRAKYGTELAEMTDQTRLSAGADQTQSEAFRKWFGDSKVVTADGKPLVVYHGTNQDVGAFKPDTGWFTANPGEASLFSMQAGRDGRNIMPAYISIKKPRIIDGDITPNWRSSIHDALTDGTIDGVIVTAGGDPMWIVPAEPTQIKSATGNNGEFSPANPDIRFARTRPTFSRGAQSQANESVETIAMAIASKWEGSPEIVVAFDMDDPIIPEKVRKEDQRQRSGGATGTPEGFYYKGVVYLMSSKLGTANDVARVLFHEALGHAGLRGAFGGALKPILRDVATLRRAEVDAKLKQYGLKGINKIDRLIAAEEVLAEMAQTRPEIGFVKRAIAAIRTWLRQNVPGFASLRLSNAELIRNYILPARRFVEQGGGPKGGVRVEPTFSRGTNKAVTNPKDVVGKSLANPADDMITGAKPEPLDDGHDFKTAEGKFTSYYWDGDKRQGEVTVHKGKSGYTIRNINLPDSAQRKGIGSKIYAWVNQQSIDATGKPLQSTKPRTLLSGKKVLEISDAGKSLWKSLERKGLAKQNSDGSYTYNQPNESTAPDSGGAMFSRSLGDTLATAANNVHDVNLPAGYTVGDLLKSAPGKLNWWHKTVGTMYNLAERSPQFKRVFDGVQNFINDVSYYATEAADLAPNILPKLESWKDIGKAPLSAEDTKAISAPIFEGTLVWARDEQGKPIKIEALEAQAATLTPEQKAQRLLRNDKVSDQVLRMWQGLPLDKYEAIIEGKYERDMLKAGIVWTPAELRSMFNLTGKKLEDGSYDGQIGLYQEFRKATDKSLTNLAISDMLRFGGKDTALIRERVLAAANVVQAGDMLRDYLMKLSDTNLDRKDVLLDTANKMVEKSEKAKDLIARGYAPLSRYGQYTLDVVDRDGERVYFGMFESKIDAARMARRMEQEYPGATITRGTVSEEEYKLFAGVSPETLELFGDMLGLEAQGDSAASKAFQTYLKLAKSNRSSMKRMIQRKGIAGFSEDSGRVLAGFVYSNARQTASNLHMGEMTDAANEVAKTQGELKDQAVRLVDYVKNPREEAQAFRGLLFAQYIGGSVASAMVNMTQPITMTFPWLSQYTSAADAAKQMASGMKDANKKQTGDTRLDAALKRAEEDGTVSPQEVHQLMQQSQGRGALRSGDGTKAGDAMAAANNALSRFSLGWGKLFSLAEQFNRRATFIAAYRTAVAKGIDAPEAFARKAIAETQGVYNKGNKPNWARGAVGSTLFTFKQYSIAYVEMLHRMATQGGPEGKKAAMLALAVLFLMSGAGGMPGGDDLDDLISGIMQRLGYNFDTKAKRQEFFARLVGEGGARFLETGVSGLPGMPLDVSGRLGMGNLIPGTGLLTKKVDHTRDLAEIAGPAGDFGKRIFEAAGKAVQGDVFGINGAARTVAPKAIQNLYQFYDMANMGMYRDAKGMKVLDSDGYDAALKAIGFQPNDVKRVQDASFEAQRMIGLNKLRETEIANRWAMGIFEKDTDKVKAAREELAEWNASNPESPIRINFKQILQRVQKMNQSKTERITATAPKEIRADVRRALEVQ